MNTNSITVCGNVVRDPELRHTSNGAATTTFGVAVNRKVFTKNDTPTEVVSFFNVVAWHSLAENICESIRKGSRIVVVGRLDQRSWEVEGENGGGRRTTYELVAEEIGASMKFATLQVQRVQRMAPDIDGSEPIRVTVPDSPEGLAVGAYANEEPF